MSCLIQRHNSGKNIGQHHSGQADINTAGAVWKADIDPNNNNRLIQANELYQSRIRLHSAQLEIQRDIILPASAQNGNQVFYNAFIEPQLQIGEIVAGGESAVHISVAAHQAVHHAQHQRSGKVEQHRRLVRLYLPLQRYICQGQHVPLQQRVGKLVIALLFHGFHLYLTGGMQQSVDSGVNDPGVIFKDSAEHFKPVFGKLPWAVEIIFTVFFLGTALCLRGQIHLAVTGRVQQSVNLALR